MRFICITLVCCMVFGVAGDFSKHNSNQDLAKNSPIPTEPTSTSKTTKSTANNTKENITKSSKPPRVAHDTVTHKPPVTTPGTTVPTETGNNTKGNTTSKTTGYDTTTIIIIVLSSVFGVLFLIVIIILIVYCFKRWTRCRKRQNVNLADIELGQQNQPANVDPNTTRENTTDKPWETECLKEPAPLTDEDIKKLMNGPGIVKQPRMTSEFHNCYRSQ